MPEASTPAWLRPPARQGACISRTATPAWQTRRSGPTWGRDGMIAAAHPLTVTAGAEIQRQGGNAEAGKKERVPGCLAGNLERDHDCTGCYRRGNGTTGLVVGAGVGAEQEAHPHRLAGHGHQIGRGL